MTWFWEGAVSLYLTYSGIDLGLTWASLSSFIGMPIVLVMMSYRRCLCCNYVEGAKFGAVKTEQWFDLSISTSIRLTLAPFAPPSLNIGIKRCTSILLSSSLSMAS